MGTDLNTAARAMADLFYGNVRMIGRYVKGLDGTIIKSGDLDRIMAKLNVSIHARLSADKAGTRRAAKFSVQMILYGINYTLQTIGVAAVPLSRLMKMILKN
jgi:hypothetical protein